MSDTRPATILDVASRAGVAISSVSRVLSNHPDVSESMKARVRAAAEELGYSPDPLAQSLRSGSTRTVGFVVRDFANPFFGEIIRGVEDALTDAGYTLLVTSSGGDPKREAERIGLLRQRRVDALLLSSNSESAEGTPDAVAAFERPVVLLDRDLSTVDAGNVHLDHAKGVREATADLLKLGHRRIAVITGTPDIRPTRERLRGFAEAHDAADVAVRDELVVTGVFSDYFARESAVRLLGLGRTRRPTAIIAGGVQSTVGVLEAFSQLDIRPGDDVSLVVCDDLPSLRVLRPAISVVTRDGEGMGRAAAELALDMLAGKEPRTVVLPTRYEPRDTSRSSRPARARATS